MYNQQDRKTLTPKDVERVYSLNIGTLGNMRYFKVGPPYLKVGKKVLYRAEDIEKYLSQNVILTSGG